MIHELKSHPVPFRDVVNGLKTYEIRVDDRDYRVGDVLALSEWDPEAKKYSGAMIRCGIKHKTSGGEWGLPPELCVLGIEVLRTGEIDSRWATRPRES